RNRVVRSCPYCATAQNPSSRQLHCGTFGQEAEDTNGEKEQAQRRGCFNRYSCRPRGPQGARGGPQGGCGCKGGARRTQRTRQTDRGSQKTAGKKQRPAEKSPAVKRDLRR